VTLEKRTPAQGLSALPFIPKQSFLAERFAQHAFFDAPARTAMARSDLVDLEVMLTIEDSRQKKVPAPTESALGITISTAG